MITFGIPLRSRETAHDWPMVSKCFNRTLWSVYCQTDPDFRIIVACHDIPELERDYDERVEFITVDAPVPKTPDEMMVDKGYKIHEIAMRLRENGAGFAMTVDADDIQSNRIAAYVNSHQGANGFVARSGYFYHVGDDYVRKGAKFPNGSSTIVNYSIDDLPERHYDPPVPSQDSNPHLIRKRHGSIPEICASLGRPLDSLPFEASIYVRDTGDNHSLMEHGYSKFRIIEQTLRPKIPLSRICEEFSIDWI